MGTSVFEGGKRLRKGFYAFFFRGGAFVPWSTVEPLAAQTTDTLHTRGVRSHFGPSDIGFKPFIVVVQLHPLF